MTAALLPPTFQSSRLFQELSRVRGKLAFLLSSFLLSPNDLLISNSLVFCSVSLYLSVYPFIPRCSLLLYCAPPPFLHPPPSLPGCRVMYGPRHHWDQWDASCFNLAPEPSRSRSWVSPKSDGTGLSPPPSTPPPPPSPTLPCAALINT